MMMNVLAKLMVYLNILVAIRAAVAAVFRELILLSWRNNLLESTPK